MVIVSGTTTDQITAWRIRDSLAQHPMLGGDSANICIVADSSQVVLEGWAMDHTIHELARKMASRAAGRRAVTMQLTVENCRRLRSISRHCTRPC